MRHAYSTVIEKSVGKRGEFLDQLSDYWLQGKTLLHGVN
jgi:hypothetical protein